MLSLRSRIIFCPEITCSELPEGIGASLTINASVPAELSRTSAEAVTALDVTFAMSNSRIILSFEPGAV